MKNKFIVGMAVVAASLSLSQAQAAVNGKSMRDTLVSYTKEVKDYAFGKGSAAKNLSAQKAQVARDKMIHELNLTSGKANALAMSINSDSAKSADRLESLATVVAAKKMSAQIAKVDAAEGKSIEDAALAAAKLLANASLTGAKNSASSHGKASLLNAQEISTTTAALQKLETLPESILTQFSKQERDSYTQIINRHNELIEMGSNQTSEEAFIQAIMDVKKVDKEKAMDIAKKLKECV